MKYIELGPGKYYNPKVLRELNRNNMNSQIANQKFANATVITRYGTIKTYRI